GVVVERVHAGVLEAAVGADGVPALPHGGGAPRDLVAPRREGVVEQQPVGDVQVPAVGQHRQQRRRAEEAGRQVPVARFDRLHQVVGGGGAQVGGQQVERQREHVAGLRAVADAAVGVDELVG